MPVATIALFALAIIVIALAFAIQQLVGGGGSDTPSPADVTGTNVANKQTATARAGGSQPTQPASSTTPAPGGAQTVVPGGSATPGRTGTAQATTPGGTPGAKTYTVKAGDNCGKIAEQFGVTAAALIAANTDINAECTNLKEDQVLKIP
jgi:LysM repeat protein